MQSLTPKAQALICISQHEQNDDFCSLPRTYQDNIPFAYAVQEELISRWEPIYGPTGGWKVGLTSERMQKMCGIDSPIAGAIFQNRIHTSPKTLDAKAFSRLGIEAELAVRISRSPDPKKTFGVSDAWSHIDAICAAFEIIEDRNADYTSLDAASLIADNSWNAGIILGEAVPIERYDSLIDIKGNLSSNGTEIESGLSQNAGGDPLAILVWLVSGLAERNRRLDPGQWVMTGSIVGTHFPVPGEALRFELSGLPPVDTSII